ncbi:MAG TPA: glycosyltransferase family 4 protein [Phycisphaerae bacterium]|nr:glycosyltransferase family 4 protein [Phycisphaerae bacterium]
MVHVGVRKVLLQLNQLPADPASGAARSMLTMAEMLASAGDRFEVHALGTSASEGAMPLGLGEYFGQQGIAAKESIFAGRRVYRYTHRRVRTTILDAGAVSPMEGERLHALTYDALLEQMLRRQKIDIVLTYGGHAEAVRRRRLARGLGCRVVFGLRNWGYMAPGAFVECDAIVTATEFVTERYRRVMGIESTAIPLPIEAEDVLAEKQERIFVTAINPSREKGLLFLIRLLEELAVRRPDIPVLIVESRGNAGQVRAAAGQFGIDLARHESIMMSGGVAKPRDIYAVARLVLMPSVWEEPAGRVAVEAMMNGIPALVSDRGGLPETVGAGGIVLGIPGHVRVESRELPGREDVAGWVEKVIELTDDGGLYERACAAAREGAARYEAASVMPRLVAFFEGVG